MEEEKEGRLRRRMVARYPDISEETLRNRGVRRMVRGRNKEGKAGQNKKANEGS